MLSRGAIIGAPQSDNNSERHILCLIVLISIFGKKSIKYHRYRWNIGYKCLMTSRQRDKALYRGGDQPAPVQLSVGSEKSNRLRPIWGWRRSIVILLFLRDYALPGDFFRAMKQLHRIARLGGQVCSTCPCIFTPRCPADIQGVGERKVHRLYSPTCNHEGTPYL